MKLSLSSITLQVAVLITLTCISTASQRNYPWDIEEKKLCIDDETPVCLNCETLLGCNTSPDHQIDCAALGLVCGEMATDKSSCFVPGVYDDSAVVGNLECDCKKLNSSNDIVPVSDDSYKDPFGSTSFYIDCLNGVPTYLSCPSGEVFNDGEKKCIIEPVCGSTTDPPVENPLDCNTYYDCQFDGILTNCTHPSQIFDVEEEACVVINPDKATCIAGDGLKQYKHPDSCYVYELCMNEDKLDNYCCGPDEVFETDACKEIPPAATCFDPLCVQEYWERTLCGSDKCAEVGDVYGVREANDCSEYYFECDAELVPFLKKCPATYPIFDPVGGYCDVGTCP